MNERFNPFRSVPREEVESDHTFHTLRYFPSISKSVNSTKKSIEILNNDKRNENNLNNSTKLKKKTSYNSNNNNNNNKLLKSTHKLDELCKSSLNEFSTLSKFRYTIINERNKQQLQLIQTTTRTTTATTRNDNNNELIDPLVSGNKKLTKFAVRYDSRRMNNDLDGFHERVLDKDYFDYQLKRCLCVYLTPEELDAVFTYIDSDKSGCIDGVEFLRYFFKLGLDAKNAIRLKAIQTTQEMEAKRAQEELEERKMIHEENLRYNVEFTEEQRNSAMSKLINAALKFEGNSTSVEFKDIVGIRLTPFEFKLFLEKTFNFKLSPSETAALLDYFATPIVHSPAPSPPGTPSHAPPVLHHSLSTASTKALWCYVDGRQFISQFLLLKEQESGKQRAQLQQYSERRLKVQSDLRMNVDLFPKQLGR